jgi:hypothetical protein
MTDFISSNYKLFDCYTGIGTITRKGQITNMINCIIGPNRVTVIPLYSSMNECNLGYTMAEIYDYYFMTNRRNFICTRHSYIYDLFKQISRDTPAKRYNDQMSAQYDEALDKYDQAVAALDESIRCLDILEDWSAPRGGIPPGPPYCHLSISESM